MPFRASLRMAVGVLLLVTVSGCAERNDARNRRVVRGFSSAGVKRVVIRAAEIETAEIQTDAGATGIEISGEPIGGAAGYHSPDPNWKETPARDWGLDFVAEAHGPLLVISSKNEIQYIHHGYRLREIKIRLPAGCEVVREKRELTGDGSPNLAIPLP
jgi:hypothetical protein